MKGSTHIVYGVLTGTLYATTMATADPNIFIATVALSTLGALLPDIDSKTSLITNTLIIPKYLPLKHRGIMHSATLATVVTALNIPLGLGMYSHILLDLLNKQKIALFVPFSNKKYGLKLCSADGIVDQALRVLGTGAIILILMM